MSPSVGMMKFPTIWKKTNMFQTTKQTGLNLMSFSYPPNIQGQSRAQTNDRSKIRNPLGFFFPLSRGWPPSDHLLVVLNVLVPCQIKDHTSNVIACANGQKHGQLYIHLRHLVHQETHHSFRSRSRYTRLSMTVRVATPFSLAGIYMEKKYLKWMKIGVPLWLRKPPFGWVKS